VPHVLAIVSQKGGVGKTTTVVNLAAAFARRGLRTLVVDIDPQGAVRYGVGLRRGHAIHGIADYLDGRRRLQELILPTDLPSLRVLLAGTVTAEASHDAYQHRLGEPGVLEGVLEAAGSRFDVVVIDTPPGLGATVRRVLEASGHVIVPLQCEPLSLQTTPQILRAIQGVIAANDGLMLDGILLTMYEEGNPVSARIADYVRQHVPPEVVFDTVVPRTLAAIDAFAAGQPVVLRDPADAASAAYVELAGVLAERFQ
jgi:chromosome partitioning protein